jgi:DNA-binding transcriptional MerR regulator
MSEPEWTLEELADRVAAVLERDGSDDEGGAAQSNGRVREIPDGRTIRWYQTTGLVDRPAMRGRTGLYGPRQLAQVVAIKRLQSEGRSLAEIQAHLAGMSDAALARLARLPDHEIFGAVGAPVAELPVRRRFWAHVDEAAGVPADFEPIAAELGDARTRAVYPSPAVPVQPALRFAVRLGAGVMLVLDETKTAPGAGDLAAIRSLTGALLRELRRRGLAPESNPRRDDP